MQYLNGKFYGKQLIIQTYCIWWLFLWTPKYTEKNNFQSLIANQCTVWNLKSETHWTEQEIN